LVLALEHLHQRGIVYRDLKLENVMLDEDGHVKLVDFGLSKENVTVPCEEPLSPCGSILYMAPELLEMTGGTSVDWWTLGILMHEMLTGRSPWKSETQNAVLTELRGKNPVKLSKELSSRGAAIISSLVQRNPRKRLGTKGATEIKSNPFFWPRLKQQSDWKKLLNKQLPPPIRPCKTKITSPAVAAAKPAGRGTGPRASGERIEVLDAATGGGGTNMSAAELIKQKANEQKQFGTQNFEKSQRNLAIKAVAVPDPSNEGSVGYEFEGFVMSEGGPTIKPKDMEMIRQLTQKR
jgi:serine/threonine protein kinase